MTKGVIPAACVERRKNFGERKKYKARKIFFKARKKNFCRRKKNTRLPPPPNLEKKRKYLGKRKFWRTFATDSGAVARSSSGGSGGKRGRRRKNTRNMKIKDVVRTLELVAPLPLQEEYDNSGLQIGLTETTVTGVLLCLDVTEPVIQEAVERGCNLVVSHHPLLFRGLKQISGRNCVERTVQLALKADVAVYSAHTSLDNARGGVNYELAERLGLREVSFLAPRGTAPEEGGSGVIGRLPDEGEAPMDFLRRLKTLLGAEAVHYACGPQTRLRQIAVCGGAGDFLADAAAAAGADLFLTGEVGYHRYFGREQQMWLAEVGHYESEQFTVQLLHRILAKAFPDVPMWESATAVNPRRTL